MSSIDKALARLEKIGGENLVRKMIAAFRSNSAQRLAAARQALAAGDLAALERAAHSLKSSAGNIGAVELVRLAAQIEDSADTGEGIDRLPEYLEAASERLAAIGARLDNELPIEPRKRVAVVEDNQDNRLLVNAILEDHYTLSEYETGAEALREMHAEKPDVILLDISLPGMDGTEVLKRLRADPELSELPVIALTAHAMAGDRQKYLNLGFDDYISKPIVDDEHMLETIGRLLG